MGPPETVYGELSHTIIQRVEARKAENALVESENRFKALFQDSPNGLVLSRLDGVTVETNRVLDELTGFNRREIVGKIFFRLCLLSKDQLHLVYKLLERIASGKPAGPNELNIVRKDGKKLLIEIKTFPVKIQNQIMMLASIKDISERKKAEESRKISEQKYRNIVELAPDSIMIFDMKCVVTSCNTASTKLSGYSKKELVGKHFSRIAPIRARDVPKFLRMLPFTLMGKLPKPFVVVYKHKNGTTRKGEVHISLLKADGKTVGLQAIMRDITKKKKAEEELLYEKDIIGTLFAHAPDFIYFKDKQARYQEVNNRFCDFLKLTVKDIVGKTALNLFSGEDAKKNLRRRLVGYQNRKSFD